MGYDREEVEAGVHRVAEWGFLNQLADLSGGIWSEREKILNSSVAEVYTELQRRSHIAKYQKDLRQEYHRKK